MTSLKSIAELRNHGVLDFAPNIRRKVCMALDEIEREVAERYVPLPCDMDGEVLNIGDSVVEVGDPSPCKVMSLIWYGDCWDVNACGMNPNLLLHVKPRTVEDVLVEFYGEFAKAKYGEDSEVLSHYADELRNLIKEGEL